ncbi:hypothetical protein TNCV_1169611 [Trichonephila clavipes]|uniref:Uncharacterized protein n=1 Tax=Trichonephila clavipes TaxID=2585209 RepID=A0A8X6VK70_TRICX|nr:hypothetical protein TNCV_1169611 [Trichonephila clavipes]
MADIRPQMLEKVIENWTSRLDYIRASRGSPMPEIIFKIFKAVVAKWSRSRTRGRRAMSLSLVPSKIRRLGKRCPLELESPPICVPLRFDIFEPQETKLPVRLTNTTNKRRLVRGLE